MIFIALGTQKFPMNRLLSVVDRLVSDGLIKEPVFAQTGYSDYKPVSFDTVDFLESSIFENKIRDCDLLITHGGVSTIMTGLKYRKPVITVPRIAKYGEHVDNHQKEIVRAFSEMNFALTCENLQDLPSLIETAKKHEFAVYDSSRKKFNDYLNNYLEMESSAELKKKHAGGTNKKLTEISKINHPNILMVGVDSKRIGGMWTVVENYMESPEFNHAVNLTYIPTNTYGSAAARVLAMLKGFGKVFWKLLTGHIDLVHVHMAEKGSTYRKGVVVHMAHLFHKKIVVQMHAGPFLDWYFTQNAKRQKWISKMFDKADRVLVLGEFWKEHLSSFVPAEKLRVLYNGTECPETNRYNPAGKKILYLGVMKKAKGTFDLLDALHKIDRKLDPEIQICLCGLPEEDGIPERIQELHLENRVKMLGWISKEDRLQLFRETMMVVHPSWFEALSMTVLEAVAHGIPVLATNISTMPEILGSDVATVPVKDPEALGEQLLKWAEDQAKREEISKIVYQRAKELFSVESNIRNTLNIYKDVLK